MSIITPIRITNIIIAVIILIIFFIFYERVFPINSNQPFLNLWTPEKLYKIKNLTNDLQKCLKKLNIEFIPIYGTLLGLIRHEGLIPWDDDMDITVDKNSYDSILKNKSLFKEYGLELVEIKGIFKKKNFIKVFHANGKKIKNKNYSWPFIDIFKYYIKNNNFYLESNTSPYEYKFLKDDFLPFKTNTFEGIPMNIPNNVDSVLNKLYGNDWETICYSSTHNHEFEKPFNLQYKVNCSEIKKENIDESIFDNVFIINLENKEDRLKTSFERLRKIGIVPKRFNALSAKSEYIIKYYNEIKNKKTIGEFACYLSHKYLWEYIYSLNIPYAIIFEDDVIFKDDLTKEHILEMINKSKGFNILFLGYCWGNRFPFNDSVTKVGTGVCTNAYVITREAIKKLLDIPDNFKLPIDNITRDFCNDNLCYISHTPYNNSKNEFGQGIIKQDFELGSSIPKELFFNDVIKWF